MPIVGNQATQPEFTPPVDINPVKEEPSFFTRRQLILIVVSSLVLLFVFGLGLRVGERRVLRKQSMIQTELTSTSIPLREQTDVRQNLEPSEFCKSYVAISIPNPPEVKKQSIELSVKNTGSAPVTGFVEIIPSTAYQGSIIMCPDSKVSQSGGKYNYMRDKSLN